MKSRLILAITAAVVVARTEDPVSYDGFEVGWMPVPYDPSSASYDLDAIPNADWMGQLPSRTPLASLSIPGTSLSYAWDTSPAWRRTQNWDILMQLESGIRYFEVELAERNGVLYSETESGIPLPLSDGHIEPRGVKNIVDYSDKGVIGYFAHWMEDHGHETVLLRIRNAEKNPDETRKHAFTSAFVSHMLDRFGFDEQIGWPTGTVVFDPTGVHGLPELHEAWGHVILLLDFDGADAPEMAEYGIYWNSTALHRDRALPVNHLSDMENKWLAVNKHMDRAAASISAIDRQEKNGDVGPLFITHASGGTKNVIPEVVAAGGVKDLPHFRKLRSLGSRVNIPKEGVRATAKDNKAVVGMNTRLNRKVEQAFARGGEKYGIVVMDYPGSNLVTTLIISNNR